MGHTIKKAKAKKVAILFQMIHISIKLCKYNIRYESSPIQILRLKVKLKDFNY